MPHPYVSIFDLMDRLLTSPAFAPILDELKQINLDFDLGLYDDDDYMVCVITPLAGDIVPMEEGEEPGPWALERPEGCAPLYLGLVVPLTEYKFVPGTRLVPSIYLGDASAGHNGLWASIEDCLPADFDLHAPNVMQRVEAAMNEHPHGRMILDLLKVDGPFGQESEGEE